MTEVRRKKGFPIGDVEALTGIKPVTLRMWEHRYGLEPSDKRSSGHRLYSGDDIARYRLIKEGLNLGLRISKLVNLEPLALIETIKASCRDKELEAYPDELSFYEILDAARKWDQTQIINLILTQSSKKEIAEFFDSYLGPLIRWVGLQWQIGMIGVNHEHFLSEIINSFLSSKLFLKDKKHDRRVVLATFEGENHSLGMRMCSVVIEKLGVEPICIGASLPVSELIQTIEDTSPEAVLLSVSEYYPAERSLAQLDKLMSELTTKTKVILGGGGATRIGQKRSGFTVVGSFMDLKEALI